MNRVKVLYAAVLGLLLLNAGMLLWLYRGQQQPGPAQPEGPGTAADFIIKELNLDSGQQRQFALLRAQHRQQIRELRERSRKLHDAYFALLKSDAPDMKTADSLVMETGKNQQAIDRLNFEHFKDLRALCRNSQKQLFDHTIDEIARRVGGPPPPPRHGGQGGPPPQHPGEGPPPR